MENGRGQVWNKRQNEPASPAGREMRCPELPVLGGQPSVPEKADAKAQHQASRYCSGAVELDHTYGLFLSLHDLDHYP